MRRKDILQPKLVMALQLSREAHSCMDAGRCTEFILERVSDMLGTELGSVMLVDEKNKELFIKKAKGLGKNIVKAARVRIGEGISGWVAKTGKPLFIRDLSRSKKFKRYRKKKSQRYTTESLISVPIKVDDKVIGVINVNNKKTKRKFTREDLLLLSFISEQVALAMKNSIVHEEARRLADLKLDFVSRISHELKNPLAIIKDSIALALETSAGNRNRRGPDILGIALRNIDRLTRLLDSLLELARLEAGKAPVCRRYIDLKRLISECADFIRPCAGNKGVAVNVDFLMRYSKIWADEDMITQVVNNILNNALKFTSKGGNVDITTKERDGKVLISVEDTGIGIKKSDLSRLFSKFERVGALKEETAGTGLGLAICKEIIDLHKGRIWAESRLHKGTRFNIILPKDLRKEERL